VHRPVFADLRLTVKIAARSMISIPLLIAKLALPPVITFLNTLHLLASAAPLLLSRSPISTQAP
jgi:hypothetical protein